MFLFSVETKKARPMQHWLTTYNVTGPLLCPTNSKIIQKHLCPQEFPNLIQETSKPSRNCCDRERFERCTQYRRVTKRGWKAASPTNSTLGRPVPRTERSSELTSGGGLETAWSEDSWREWPEIRPRWWRSGDAKSQGRTRPPRGPIRPPPSLVQPASWEWFPQL